MRQGVLIAMPLACQPLLLIADEPTTALDVTIQAEILDLLQEMKEKFHLALMLITHDLGAVAGHATPLSAFGCEACLMPSNAAQDRPPLLEVRHLVKQFSRREGFLTRSRVVRAV